MVYRDAVSGVTGYHYRSGRGLARSQSPNGRDPDAASAQTRGTRPVAVATQLRGPGRPALAGRTPSRGGAPGRTGVVRDRTRSRAARATTVPYSLRGTKSLTNGCIMVTLGRRASITLANSKCNNVKVPSGSCEQLGR